MTNQPVPASLHPIPRVSLPDAVFAQIRDQIVSGEMKAGSSLPAERVLCAKLGVNRGAVREALRRLEQARLVSVRHGGSSVVLDYRTSAGMDLLADLMLSNDGEIDLDVVRGVVEMRSAIAPDVARLAALRGGPAISGSVREIVDRMRETADLAELQHLSHAFWKLLVSAAENLAYQLAFNSLREVYERSWETMRPVLADELTAIDDFEGLAVAVEQGDSDEAERCARSIVRLGESRIAEVLGRLEPRIPLAPERR